MRIGTTLNYTIEKLNLKEMAIVSTRSDVGLKDIDIAVYSGEHFPKHANIIKRNDHKISYGRFIITPKPPIHHQDIQEVKEEIDTEYKRQVFEWAKKPNALLKGQTNWEALDTVWNILNHK
jgi:hypothetical protein